jgi:hypothetical protein
MDGNQRRESDCKRPRVLRPKFENTIFARRALRHASDQTIFMLFVSNSSLEPQMPGLFKKTQTVIFEDKKMI